MYTGRTREAAGSWPRLEQRLPQAELPRRRAVRASRLQRGSAAGSAASGAPLPALPAYPCRKILLTARVNSGRSFKIYPPTTGGAQPEAINTPMQQSYRSTWWAHGGSEERGEPRPAPLRLRRPRLRPEQFIPRPFPRPSQPRVGAPPAGALPRPRETPVPLAAAMLRVLPARRAHGPGTGRDYTAQAAAGGRGAVPPPCAAAVPAIGPPAPA
ncbi:proline-rich protein 2-like [Chiroxiphia lanceolata]|uniref:proline-rich protein 2-like n=1 Tax=Chiroxiphia lanceolata TaxID=296741 RepID=UPI0013CEAE63|nr:proline-rich protein 2-like [Chiroxiphia lanceolata]